jgi:RecA-family ATPase
VTSTVLYMRPARQRSAPTTHPLDPHVADHRRWHGRAVVGGLPWCIKPHHNNFFVISSFRPGVDGVVRRRKENFAACHVIMVDDVGTKVPEYRLDLDPSYLFETSPANHQAGYLLDPPETDRVKVERLLDEMVRCGLAMDGADPGMRGVTRYARLPVGQNNKAKYVERLGAPFVHQVATWAPELTYTVEEIAKAYGLDLHQRVIPFRTARTSARPGAKGILSRLAAADLYIAPSADGRGRTELDVPGSTTTRTETTPAPPTLSHRRIAAGRGGLSATTGIASITISGLLSGSCTSTRRWVRRRAMGNEDRYRWAADYVDANREGPDTPSYPPIPPLSELRLSLADLRAASLTPACIVDRYLWADVGAIPGPGGTGKTSLFLFEAIHIVLGRPLYGLEVRAPGNVVIVTAEDRKGILMARLRQIMEAMGLNEEEQSRVCAGVLIWDVTGSVCRLTELDRHGNVVLTGLADAIVERFRDEPSALMGLDPVISFGAGERIVNDNEHSLILAARRIVRGLGCCVRLICHTGQVAARSMVLDQYASRGGSALADGCRMVTVLQAWQDDNEKLTPPAGFTLGAGEQGIVMARAKISYAPPQPLIWLKRRGWTFEHFIDMPATKEDEASARADQVWRYLADQLKSGARHTKTDLEAAGILPQKKLRATLIAAGYGTGCI